MDDFRRKKISYLLRLILTIIVIAIILLKVHWADLFSILAKINLWYVAPFYLLSFVMIWVSCLKWQILLKVRKIQVAMPRLLSLYLIGYFFNYFTPGSHGGDLARSYILGREIKTISESASSVFMERFTGLTALVVFTFFASFVNIDLLRNTTVLVPVLVTVIGYLVLLFLLFSEKIRTLSLALYNRFHLVKLIRKINECHLIVLSFKGYKRVVANSLSLSFVFHLLTILNVIIACLCFDIQIDFLQLALFVPIIQLACMVPISINGFGIQEGVYIYLFSLVGIPMHEALAVSLILRFKNISLSLIGGILFSVDKNKFSRKVAA